MYSEDRNFLTRAADWIRDAWENYKDDWKDDAVSQGLLHGLGVLAIGLVAYVIVDNSKNPTYSIKDPEGTVDVTPTRLQALERLSDNFGKAVDFNTGTLYDVKITHGMVLVPITAGKITTYVPTPTEDTSRYNGIQINKVTDSTDKARIARMTQDLKQAQAFYKNGK